MTIKASNEFIPQNIEFAEGMHIRACSYLVIFLGYVLFMSRYATFGLEWASYHSQRLFNVAEYLRLNGYASTFGFSIWSSCTECNLLDPSWKEKIYLSSSALLSLWPYISLNELGGKEFFYLAGPLLDRTTIFITGVLLVELLLALISRSSATLGHEQPSNSSTALAQNWFNDNDVNKRQATILRFWLGSAAFLLFCSSVWTYQMYRAMWNEAWFQLFFLVSLSLLLKNKFRLACLTIFLGACMHPTLGLVFAFTHSSFYILSNIFREEHVFNSFIPFVLNHPRRLFVYCAYSVIPTLISFGLRLAYSKSTGMKGIGSSLLFRIGVSGDDIHNGGVLGALQFLGGGRITMCAEPLFKAGLAKLDLETKIAAYNCGLSISGLLVVSILTILGIFWIVANFRLTKILVFPLAMSLIILASTLQQSFSVHLLGHSYPFAALFAVGTIGLLLMTLQRLRHKSLGTLVLTPLTFAIVLLSIRVTMLTSIANG